MIDCFPLVSTTTCRTHHIMWTVEVTTTTAHDSTHVHNSRRDPKPVLRSTKTDDEGQMRPNALRQHLAGETSLLRLSESNRGCPTTITERQTHRAQQSFSPRLTRSCCPRKEHSCLHHFTDHKISTSNKRSTRNRRRKQIPQPTKRTTQRGLVKSNTEREKHRL